MYDVNLVLEGGGMRGFYTAGVLDFFLEKNLEFNFIIGTSAGACCACSFISKQLKRNYHAFGDYLNDPNYMGLNNLIHTGNFFNYDFIFDTIPNKLIPFDYKQFNKFKGKFYSVSTNIETGEADYHLNTNLHIDADMDYIKASMALPMISKPINIDGKLLLDGGVADSIPIRKAMELGSKKSIVVLTQAANFRKQPNKLMPILEKTYSSYPKLIKALENRHNDYNNSLNFINLLEKTNNCFVIRPSTPITISNLETDKEKLDALYNQGYNDAKNSYKKMINFLGN